MSTSSTNAAAANADDVRHILGDLEDVMIAEILALHPSVSDLEEAAIWAEGDSDLLAKSGRPLGPIAGDIVALLAAEEEEEPPPAAH